MPNKLIIGALGGVMLLLLSWAVSGQLQIVGEPEDSGIIELSSPSPITEGNTSFNETFGNSVWIRRDGLNTATGVINFTQGLRTMSAQPIKFLNAVNFEIGQIAGVLSRLSIFSDTGIVLSTTNDQINIEDSNLTIEQGNRIETDLISANGNIDTRAELDGDEWEFYSSNILTLVMDSMTFAVGDHIIPITILNGTLDLGSSGTELWRNLWLSQNVSVGGDVCIRGGNCLSSVNNLTNVAFINTTNTFLNNQTFNGNVTIRGTLDGGNNKRWGTGTSAWGVVNLSDPGTIDHTSADPTLTTTIPIGAFVTNSCFSVSDNNYNTTINCNGTYSFYYRVILACDGVNDLATAIAGVDVDQIQTALYRSRSGSADAVITGSRVTRSVMTPLSGATNSIIVDMQGQAFNTLLRFGDKINLRGGAHVVSGCKWSPGQQAGVSELMIRWEGTNHSGY